MKAQTRRRPILDKLATSFDEEFRFFRGWLDGPKTVGSVLPTSAVTARRMASVIDTASGMPVLELGPGTGAITKAILAHGVKPEDLYSVEYSPEFFAQLVDDFPGVNFFNGDAFDLDETLGDMAETTFDSVISGIPLLNFPVARRVQLVESLLAMIPDGRPIVQISYGLTSPVPEGRGNYVVRPLAWVARNFPPARLWTYSRPAN